GRDGARRALRAGSPGRPAEKQAAESRARPEPAPTAMPPPRATVCEARFASTRGTPPERARRRPPSPSAVWPGTVASERPHAAYLVKQAMDVLLPELFVGQLRAAGSPCEDIFVAVLAKTRMS